MSQSLRRLRLAVGLSAVVVNEGKGCSFTALGDASPGAGFNCDRDVVCKFWKRWVCTSFSLRIKSGRRDDSAGYRRRRNGGMARGILLRAGGLLFGQYQFSIAGDAQRVTVVTVIDQDAGIPLKQLETAESPNAASVSAPDTPGFTARCFLMFLVHRFPHDQSYVHELRREPPLNTLPGDWL